MQQEEHAPRPAPVPVALDGLVGLAGAAAANGTTSVTGVELDSRLVQPGDVFAALPGHRTHGARHVADALARGAVAVLTDAQGRAAIPEGIPVRIVPDPRARLGPIAAQVYRLRPGDPLRERITVVGVTGTNGKTTVTHLVQAGCAAAGMPTGVIGTVGIRIGEREIPATRTTPEAVHLVAMLAAMAESGVRIIAMEVSSHALSERRMDGVRVDLAAFTNLSQDHLDYHGTMEAYFRAKAMLFTPPHAKAGVVCVDDAWGRRLLAEATIPVQSASMEDSGADWIGRVEDGILEVRGPERAPSRIRVPLPGAFNRSNALVAWAMLRTIGVTAEDAAQGIRRSRVPGRMEDVTVAGGARGIVDYAHTPEAIERALAALREDLPQGRQLIAVLGAGGDRDASKRPAMGAAAASLADRVIVTDDNPRSESPAGIRAALLEGARAVSKAVVEEVAGRRAAIDRAASVAREGDVVVLLGKGHETGIEINGNVEPFDDREQLTAALRRAQP